MQSPFAPAILLCLSIAACAPEEKPPLKPAPAPPSTSVQLPQRPNGMTDYTRVYEDICSKGVTAENNAGPLLLRVLGHPLYYKKEYFKEVCDKLKVSPDDDERFVHFGEVLHAVWEAGAAEPKISPRGMRVVNLLPAGAAAEYRRKYKDKDAFAAALYRDNPIPPEGPWTAQQFPLLDILMRVNEQPMEILRQAAAKERLHLPAVYPPDGPFMIERINPSSVMYREGSKLLLTRAMNRLQRGDHEGAWDDVKSCYRLAALVGQEPSVMAGLGTISIEFTAHDTTLRLAVEGGLSAAQLRRCTADLGEQDPVQMLVRAADIDERLWTLDSAGLLRASLKNRKLNVEEQRVIEESIAWPEVVAQLNRWSDDRVAALTPQDYTQRLNAVKANNERRLAHGKRMVTKLVQDAGELVKKMDPQAAARLDTIELLWLTSKDLPPPQRAAALTQGTAAWLIGTASGPGESAITGSEVARTKMDLTRLTFALMAHRAETGAFPANLSDLVPRFLPQIPPDHFTGHPLNYQPMPGGFRLYSVGANLKDDGGAHTTADTDASADIVVRVDQGKVVEQRYGRRASGEIRFTDEKSGTPPPPAALGNILEEDVDLAALPAISSDQVERLGRLLTENSIPFAVEFKGRMITVYVPREHLPLAQKLRLSATSDAKDAK